MFFFACVVVIVTQMVGQQNNKSYLRAMKICSNTTKIYKELDFFFLFCLVIALVSREPISWVCEHLNIFLITK